MEANMEGILGSIFIDFWSILRAKLGWKIDQKSKKIDAETVWKIDVFLKASWNAIFSAKRREKSPSHAPRGSARRNVRIPGEDYGGEQEAKFPRTFWQEDLDKKI